MPFRTAHEWCSSEATRRCRSCFCILVYLTAGMGRRPLDMAPANLHPGKAPIQKGSAPPLAQVLLCVLSIPRRSRLRTSGHESGFTMPPWCSPLKICPVQPEIVKALAKEVANCRLPASEKSNKYQRRLRAISIVARRTRTESRGIRLPSPPMISR